MAHPETELARKVEHTGADPDRALVASVVFLDIVGYSTHPVSSQLQIKCLFNDVVFDLVKHLPEHERVILDTGDGAAIAFLASPEDAFAVATNLQDALSHDEQGNLSDLSVRIGINLGPVRHVTDMLGHATLVGDGLNDAQRVMSFAAPNQIVASRSFHDMVAHLSVAQSSRFSYLGARDDKHGRSHDLYEIATSRVTDANGVARAFPGKPADQKSIAVLPFASLSSDPEQGYFADGIAEDLITEFSRLSGLFVIARQSAFAFKDDHKRAEEIGKDLGVTYLLQGSVRRSGDHVRVTAQLIDAHSGQQMWADRYDRELNDIFAVQDSIVRSILAALRVRLTPFETEQLGMGTHSIEAHDHLLRGLERYWTYTSESTEAAKEHFLKAIEVDPGYAFAHAWLARAYVYQYSQAWRGDEALELANRHARRAVELDSYLPLARAVLGWVLLWSKRHEEAVTEGRQAIALDPNNADAHMFLALTLSAIDRGEEGFHHIEKAMRLNPQPSAFYLFALGNCHIVQGRLENAIEDFRQGVALQKGFIPNWVFLAMTYSIMGREQEGLQVRDELLKISGDPRHLLRLLWGSQRLRELWERHLSLLGLNAGSPLFG